MVDKVLFKKYNVLTKNKKEVNKVTISENEELSKKLLQIIFEKAGSEGVSVDDVKEITQEMIARMTEIRITLEH